MSNKVYYDCRNPLCDVGGWRYASQVRSAKGIYCSRECKSEHQKVLNLGESNPNFRTGVHVNPTCDCGNEKDYRAAKCRECSNHWAYVPEIILMIEDGTLQDIISGSATAVSAAGKLGVSRSALKQICIENGIDTSHFPTRNKTPSSKNPLCISEFRRNGVVKKYVLENNLLEYICHGDKCPNPEPSWAGKKLVLQLDHINGDGLDNRIENLRFLCPNCHSQTETYVGNKNRKAR